MMRRGCGPHCDRLVAIKRTYASTTSFSSFRTSRRAAGQRQRTPHSATARQAGFVIGLTIALTWVLSSRGQQVCRGLFAGIRQPSDLPRGQRSAEQRWCQAALLPAEFSADVRLPGERVPSRR